MPHEGMDHASRRNEKCITREENFHHDEKISLARQEIGIFFITLLPKY